MSEAEAIHKNALIVDCHADTPQRFLDEGWDFTSPLNGGMINLESARQGNLAAEFFALWVDPAEHPVGTHAHRALALLDSVLEQVRKHPAELALCCSPAEIIAARRSGRFAVLLGLEGGHAIENSLALLRTYHRLGVRYMTLTWANNNDWADSSGDHPEHNGLTAFGQDVVREMNRLGMMVDISHVSDKTFRDVLDVSAAPVIASHSCARALTRSPRNLTDDQLRAIAQRNGVVMVNFYPAFIDDTWRLAWDALRPQRQPLYDAEAKPYRDAGLPVPFDISTRVDRILTARIPRPPFSALTAHLNHMVEVAGINHVGIGSDFDGIQELPQGIDSAADLSKITEALHGIGYTAEDLDKLLGRNLLRVFSEVQRLG